MRPEIDLSLLRDSLTQLEETTYFSAKLHEFTHRLIGAINHVLSDLSRYDRSTIALFASHMRLAQRYLEGSTIKEAPYEMEYCLKAVLPHWVKRESLITTALTTAQDFHFAPADPWAFIRNTISGFDTAGFDALLVLVGVPKLYAHKPLYCIPLYHEVGHFVDMTLGVTQMSLLINSHAASPFERSHRQEFFADLFAACYVGRASSEALQTIAPNNAASHSHPSTKDRVALVESFLRGSTHPYIELFQQSLQALKAPTLSTMSVAPNIKEALDDIRPYVIKNEAELHGLFESGWSYLDAALDRRGAPWAATLTAPDIERIVNDLIEKSFRNHSIKLRWENGAP